MAHALLRAASTLGVPGAKGVEKNLDAARRSARATVSHAKLFLRSSSKPLQQWLSPVAEVDPRPGGHYRLEVSKPEGSHVVTGEYLESRKANAWP